jgi:hypothetical protein
MIDELGRTKESAHKGFNIFLPKSQIQHSIKKPYLCSKFFSMQNLPIGEQNFAKIRDLDMLYVDKTEQICQLLKGGSYNFISRPRRFGKSLTLSTIQCIFEGKKELFKGLWVENNWDWTQKHPVIHLSFNALDYKEGKLESALSAFLDQQAERFGVSLHQTTAKEKLGELVLKVAQVGAPVVFLVDEYDKPLIDYLDKAEIEQAKTNRNILKNFYGSLKTSEVQAAMRFFLITGVSKFSQLSLFSDLNCMVDISFNSKNNALFGFTREELLTYFDEYLVDLNQEFPSLDRASLVEKIQGNYGGYSWDGNERVHAPYSIVSLFSRMEFHDCWFPNATPSFLICALNQNPLQEVERIVVNSMAFASN